MTNIRYEKGLILAVTAPKSLKAHDREIYYVESESNPDIRYRVNFEDGTCECGDFKHREEMCKHFYKVVMEKAIGCWIADNSSNHALDIVELSKRS